MIVVGCGFAIAVMIAIGIATRRKEESDRPVQDRQGVAASILYQMLVSGGMAPDAALREIRRSAGLVAQVTTGIDVANWSEAFAQGATRAEKQNLLETAVRLIAMRESPVPLRQYATLLDLSFGLGFQTDALARLREQYGFEYVDHAKDARPREADRAGGRLTLFGRDERDAGELLRVLGIGEMPASRQVIIAAYRKLVVQHHPDRYHDQPAEAQAVAAARFIEITRAYESLLTLYRE